MWRHIPDPASGPRVNRSRLPSAAALLAVALAGCDAGPAAGPDAPAEAPTGATGVRTTRGPGGIVVRSAEGAAAVSMHRTFLRKALERASTPEERWALQEATDRFETAVEEDDPTISPDGGADFEITLAQTGVTAEAPSANGTVDFGVNVVTYTNEPAFMEHSTNVSAVSGGWPSVEDASFWPSKAFLSGFTVYGVDCRSANRVSARSSHRARQVLTALFDVAASAGRADCRGRCTTLVMEPGSACDTASEGGGDGGESCTWEVVIIEVNDGSGWREIWRGRLLVCG